MRRPRPPRRDRSLPAGLTGPVRTCLGCGMKTGKPALVRFASVEGELTIDEAGCLPGRGVYCCRDLGCLRQVVRQRKKLAWLLRSRRQEKSGDLLVGGDLEAVFGRVAGLEESAPPG